MARHSKAELDRITHDLTEGGETMSVPPPPAPILHAALKEAAMYLVWWCAGPWWHSLVVWAINSISGISSIRYTPKGRVFQAHA